MKSRTKSKSKKSPLDKMLQQLTECLTAESAKRLIKLRADAESQKQIDEWADKCTEGTLSPEERDEYGEVVRLGTYISILKSKARQMLGKEGS